MQNTNIKVTGAAPSYKANSARANWWAVVQQYNGQPVAAFVAHVATKPPSLQPNGKYGKAGQVEPPMGWLRFFASTKATKQGQPVIALVPVAAPKTTAPAKGKPAAKAKAKPKATK